MPCRKSPNVVLPICLRVAKVDFLVFFFFSDHSLIGIGRLIKGVFFSSVGRYQLNYFEAERLCGIHGATLASVEQLTAAWEEGLEQCRYLAQSTIFATSLAFQIKDGAS